MNRGFDELALQILISVPLKSEPGNQYIALQAVNRLLSQPRRRLRQTTKARTTLDWQSVLRLVSADACRVSGISGHGVWGVVGAASRRRVCKKGLRGTKDANSGPGVEILEAFADSVIIESLGMFLLSLSH